ncbi:MAG: Fe-S cluster assembly protein SufD [Myxococcota bacterium]
MALLDSLLEGEAASGAWPAALREAARAALDAGGLPGRKTEAWRFTSVRAVTAADARADAGGLVVEAPEHVPGTPGVEVLRLSGAAPSKVDAWLASVEATLPNEHFVALNGAIFDELVVLHVTGHVAGPVTVTHHGAKEGATSTPRLLVVLEPNAEMTLVERFEGAAKGLTNAVTQVSLGANAGLRHLRVHEVREASLIGALGVAQARDSRYRSLVVSLGGRLARLDLRVRLEGAGSRCDLDGLYHVGGTDHVDHHLRVEHLAPHATSTQTYRGVLDERGVSVFDGQAHVTREGPGAEAHQQNRNLLLSESARAHTKPHLEIDHDEVVASHGATVGSLDEDALFYLRARGVPREDARTILVHAFLRELLAGAPEPFRDELSAALRARLPRGEVTAEMELALDVDAAMGEVEA